MRTATKTVAAGLGVWVGITGLELGYFEALQGNTPPAGLRMSRCQRVRSCHRC